MGSVGWMESIALGQPFCDRATKKAQHLRWAESIDQHVDSVTALLLPLEDVFVDRFAALETFFE